MRALGRMEHEECSPWCNHEPEEHHEKCDDSFCDGSDCWIEYEKGETMPNFDLLKHPPVGQAALNKQAADLMDRVNEEQRKQSNVEIVLDSTNEVSFPGYDYKFRALGE